MIDVLFLLLMTFVFMFIILIAILKTEESPHKITDRNQYVIKMTWTADSRVDLDLWMLLPNERAVGFRQKDVSGSFLQRDDLGLTNDVIVTPNGKTTYSPLNEETINIRTVIPGRHYINVHMFKSSEPPNTPITVELSIIQVTPFKEIIMGAQTIKIVGQELTLAIFDLDETGIKLGKVIDYPFVLLQENVATQTNPNGF